MTTRKHGDFTGLAADYSKYRPAYAPQVATAISRFQGRPTSELDAADVGAGTGIWTRMLAGLGYRSVTAVEPNDDMRGQGVAASSQTKISWRAGSGEVTNLPSGSVDLATMASSFHWPDFDLACKEFHRILRPEGVFVALWNPRLIEVNPMLVEIESEISRLKPEIKRVSSGRSGLTERLTEMLSARAEFKNVLYLEGRHVASQTPAEYLGVWRSVNDLQVQLGPQLFQRFLDFVTERTAAVKAIETTYLTRAWLVQRA